MNDLCKEWLEVLESGKYKKAKGVPGILYADENGACPFGVAVHYFNFDFGYLRYEGVAKKLGIPTSEIGTIIGLCDSTDFTLPQIAVCIRSILTPMLPSP